MPGLGRPARAWAQTEWPQGERLGRVCASTAALYAKPSTEGEPLRKLAADEVFPWLREVVGGETYLSTSRRWVETPEGYIYAPLLQPVQNQVNTPVETLPEGPLGRGMWAEVSVPYLDLTLEYPSKHAPWLQAAQYPRFYYSQVYWIDDLKTGEDGQVYYRAVEKYAYGDVFWALASGFRPLTREEVEPIHTQAEDKRVKVYLGSQMLTCLEDSREVYACRISSGVKFDPAG